MSALIIAMAASISPATASAPQRVTVFTGRAAALMLHQCSRGVPAAGSGWFRPTAAQIAKLDAAAAREASRPGTRRDGMEVTDLGSLRRRYAVEVVGIVRGGRRYVYGSYLPLAWQEGVKEAPSTPTVVCDGGPRLFGIEIDAATGAVTHSAHNGPG